MRHYPPAKCTCGHSWEQHHHGCIMNPKYFDYQDAHDYGVCGGVVGQECERTELNGIRIREDEPECFCGGYVNSKTLLQLRDLVDRVEGRI